jgi:hypothetical protein
LFFNLNVRRMDFYWDRRDLLVCPDESRPIYQMLIWQAGILFGFCFHFGKSVPTIFVKLAK